MRRYFSLPAACASRVPTEKGAADEAQHRLARDRPAVVALRLHVRALRQLHRLWLKQLCSSRGGAIIIPQTSWKPEMLGRFLQSHNTACTLVQYSETKRAPKAILTCLTIHFTVHSKYLLRFRNSDVFKAFQVLLVVLQVFFQVLELAHIKSFAPRSPFTAEARLVWAWLWDCCKDKALRSCQNILEVNVFQKDDAGKRK